MERLINLNNAPQVYLLTFKTIRKYNLKSFYTGVKWYSFFSTLLDGHVKDFSPDNSVKFAFAPLEHGGTNLIPGDKINIRVLLPESYSKIFFDKLSNLPYPTTPSNSSNIMDYFSYESAINISPNIEDLSTNAAKLNTMNQLHLRFITPMRINAPKGEAKLHNTSNWKCPKFLCDSFFSHLPGLGLKHLLFHIFKRVEELGLLRKNDIELKYPEYNKVSLIKNNLLWHNTFYSRSRTDNNKSKVNLFNGAPGEIIFDWHPDCFWAKLLVLAQHYHVSRSKNFGFGYFDLPDINDTTKNKSENIYSRLMSYKRLKNRIDILPERNQDKELLQRLSKQKVNELSSSPSNLKIFHSGFRVTKNNGSKRLLTQASPLEKLVLQELNSMLGNGLNDYLGDKGSFAYRSGSSPQRAAKELFKHQLNGNNWIFRADIKNFFSSISHNLLKDKLHALYGSDPIVNFIMLIVTAPILIDGQEIEQTKGIAEGLPISPLLSNIALEGFDRYCNIQKLNLIRYSDDIAVPCKSKNKAEQAKKIITKQLAKLGFELNKEKSRIEELTDDYEFLGVNISQPDTFIKSKNKQLQETISKSEYPNPFTMPPCKKTLYLGGKIKKTRIESNSIVAFDISNKRIKCCRVNDVKRVIAVGNIGVTASMIRRCIYQRIPVFFVDKMGRSIGAVEVEKEPSTQLNKLQQALITDKDQSLKWAKGVVQARLSNAARVLDRNRTKQDSSELKGIVKACNSAKTLAELRGIEGQGTKLYWSKWALMTKPFDFTCRNRRPPKDAVNAILSLLYTVLYNRMTESIKIAGLNPRLGFYHTGHGRHNALASDLMEEFRHLVEMTVLRLIGKNMLKLEHFPDGVTNSTGFKLPSKVFSKVVFEFEETLRSEVKAGRSKPLSYAEWLDESAFDMRASLLIGQQRTSYYAV